MLTVLEAALEEELHAQADAQQRLARVRGGVNGLVHSRGAELGVGVRKRPDAGENYALCPEYRVCVPRDHALSADGGERTLEREEVPHAVVYDGHPSQHPLGAGQRVAGRRPRPL